MTTAKSFDPTKFEAARQYVDKQIETMKRYGSAPEEDLSEEEYNSLVEEIVDAIDLR
jgi:hypothetical protein